MYNGEIFPVLITDTHATLQLQNLAFQLGMASECCIEVTLFFAHEAGDNKGFLILVPDAHAHAILQIPECL